MAKKEVNYKKLFELVFDLLKKLSRKDIPVSDLANIIKDIEKKL